MALGRLARSHGDWVAALTLAVLLQIEIWTVDIQHGATRVDISSTDRAVAAVAGLVLTIALAWRRRWPLAVLAVAIATAVVAQWSQALNATTVSAVAIVVAAYSVGAHTQGARAVVGALGVAALIVVATIGDFTPADLLFVTMIIGGGWLAGRAIRAQRRHGRALERLTFQLEHEREQNARSAVAEERVRIAREMHDVVAHAISVIVLQARGGRRSLARDPADTREALDTIERTGTQALTEMRRLLGILRSDNEAVALAPQPGLAHIEALVDEVRDAGLWVDVCIEGEPVDLPPGVDLSAFRIIQEALTNAIKHAGPATARVLVRYDQDSLGIEIADTGAGTRTGGAEGHGLVGMRERVSVYGGMIETGAPDGGGFAVRARLPLDRASS